jgi:hypothetical protein
MDEAAPAEVEPGRSGVALLHQRHHRVPKGAVLTHRNMLFQTQAYFADIDRLAPTDAASTRRRSRTARALRPASLRRRRGERHPESGQFDRRRSSSCLERWPAPRSSPRRP